MSEKCLLSLKEKYKDMFKSDKELNDIADEISTMVESGKPITKGEIKKFLETKEKMILKSRAQHMISIEKSENFWKMVNDNKAFQEKIGKDGKVKRTQLEGDTRALRAMISNDPGANYKGYGTVERYAKAYESQVIATFSRNLENLEGGLAIAKSGELDIEVARYVLDGDKNVSNNAKILGEAYRKAYDADYKHKTEAGFFVDYHSGYLGAQKHPAHMIYKMGDDWKALAKKTWDFDKMGFTDEAAIDSYLDSMADKAVRKRGMRQESEITDDFIRTETRAGKRIESSRSVYFKDGASFIEYQRAMQPGKNLFDNLADSLNYTKGKVGAARIFGPDFKNVYQNIHEKIVERANISQEKPDFKTLEATRREFDYAVFGSKDGNSGRLAKSLARVRNLQNMNKLHTALFTTVTDFGSGAAIIKSVTGKGFLDSTASLVSEFSKNFADMSDANVREIGERLGVFMDDIILDQFDRGIGDVAETGGFMTNWFDKAHRTYMKATGLPRQAKAIRTAIANIVSDEFSKHVDKNFSDLHIGTKNAMSEYGIMDNEWKVLSIGTEMIDGRKTITMEGIEDVPVEKVMEIFGVNKNKAEYIKGEVALKYSSLLTDIAEKGSPTPGVRERAFMNAFPANTPSGQLMRFAMQFKSFSLSMFKTLSSIATNTADANGKLPIDAGLFATYAASSIGYGYLALAAKDIAKGRQPRDPSDPKTVMESFLQAGTGTMFADLLLTDYTKSKRTLAGDLAGPGIGFISDTHELATKLIDKDRKPKSKEKALLKYLEYNTPNLPHVPILKKKLFEAMQK